PGLHRGVGDQRAQAGPGRPAVPARTVSRPGTARARFRARAGARAAVHRSLRSGRRGPARRLAHRGRLADHAAGADAVPGPRTGGQVLGRDRVPTRANGQPAFGLYIRDPQAGVAHAYGVLVLTLAGPQISVVTGFTDNGALRIFGLPR